MYWTTKEGKKIKIEDMTTTHLINTIKMLDRNETYSTYIGGVDALDIDYYEEYWCDTPIYKALKKELIDRKLGLK